jgi:hypothetical protein
MTRVAIKTFTFEGGSKSMSIDNAVLGTLDKFVLFTMLQKTDFTGSPDSNPYYFRHLAINHFVMYVNARQVPSEGLTLNTACVKTWTMAYQKLFSGLGIRGNAGIQITSGLFVKGCFMFIFVRTPDGCA